MKPRTFTMIDTGGHAYLSVPKQLIIDLGLTDKISGYSGLSATRVYLEEDCDAPMFLHVLDKEGVLYTVKDGYNPKFNITHNYSKDLIDLKVGDIVVRSDGYNFKITAIAGEKVTIDGFDPISYSKLCKILK